MDFGELSRAVCRFEPWRSLRPSVRIPLSPGVQRFAQKIPKIAEWAKLSSELINCLPSYLGASKNLTCPSLLKFDLSLFVSPPRSRSVLPETTGPAGPLKQIWKAQP